MKNLKNVTVRFVDISESSEIESYYVKQSYDNNGSQHMLYTVYSDDGLYRDSDFAKDGLRYNPYLVGETLDETQKNVAEKIASYYGLDADDACDTIIIMPYDEHIKNQIPDIATYLQAKVLADNQNYSINHDVQDLIKHNTEDIIMSENKQPLFGDVLPNSPGNDGYGFEEHERFVGSDEPTPAQTDKVKNGYMLTSEYKDKPVICIMAGSNIGDIEGIAAEWRMNRLGDAFFDDGEAMSPEHIKAQTAVYYENDIASKSSAFVKSVMEKYPDVLVSLQEEYNKDIGDDVTRFDNTNILDFDGLDEQEMGL